MSRTTTWGSPWPYSVQVAIADPPAGGGSMRKTPPRPPTRGTAVPPGGAKTVTLLNWLVGRVRVALRAPPVTRDPLAGGARGAVLGGNKRPGGPWGRRPSPGSGGPGGWGGGGPCRRGGGGRWEKAEPVSPRKKRGPVPVPTRATLVKPAPPRCPP